MLVVRDCIPGESSEKLLKPGDVLLEVNRQPCVDFVHLESILDDRVGSTLAMSLCRAGQRIEVDFTVQDLHALIPQSFVELALGVFHGVPYQTAMKHHVPLRGVYVAQAGFVCGQALSCDVIISALNGEPCHDIESFLDILKDIPDKEYFSMSWTELRSEKGRRMQNDFGKMHRQWSLLTAWNLQRQTGRWVPRHLQALRCHGSADSEESTTASACDDILTSDESPFSDDVSLEDMQQSNMSEECAEKAVVADCPPAKRAKTAKFHGALASLECSICSIVFKVVQNFALDIFPGKATQDIISIHGAGVVVDVDKGLILTDRGTVPQRLGDIEVTLGDDSRSASVFHMHPDHSIVVLKLDDDSDQTLPNFGKAAKLEERDFEAGEEVEFVGIDTAGRLFSTLLTVRAYRLGNFPRHWPLRWGEKNLEAILFVDEPPDSTSGVLCDSRGHVFALYAALQAQQDGEAWSCGYGIPVQVLMPIVDQLAQPGGSIFPPVVPSLGLDFQTFTLQKLQRLPSKLRPSAEWSERLRTMGDNALQVTSVSRSGPCYGIVKVGDLLVSVQHEVVASVSMVEAMLRKATCDTSMRQLENGKMVQIIVLRSGMPLQLEVTIPLLSSDGSTRVLFWHGLLLQDTPRIAVDAQIGSAEPFRVHIATTLLGSPADTCEVPGEFLVTVDGKSMSSLDAIVEASSDTATLTSDKVASPGNSDRRCLRIETADTAGRRFVTTLLTDPLYWPTVELSQDQSGVWNPIECGCQRHCKVHEVC
jgi:S1-C subfamily serine protease